MSEAVARVVVRLADQIVATVALSDQALTIGRNPDNGLPLTTSSQVSRYHADLRLSPQGLLVTDVGSANGTFVGEERLLPHQPHLIVPGASFRVGPFEITFELVGGPEPDAGDPEPEPAPPPKAEQEASASAADAEQGEAPKDGKAPKGGKATKEKDGAAPEDGETPEAAPASLPTLPSTLAPTASQEIEPSAPPPGHLTRRERLMAGLPSAPPPLPPYHQPSRYLNNLPMIFHENDFLRRYMLIFEAIWEPLEYRQDHIDLYFDPRTCPQPAINWLAQWFGLSINPHWPEGRRRQVLAQIFDLYRWRGTRHGLALMIEVCTGITPEIDDSSTPFVFAVRLQVPPGHSVDRSFLETLIETHKPAHAGYTLELTG